MCETPLRDSEIPSCDNAISLRGCKAEPLLGYLAGLGVVRLVAEQVNPEVSARWDGDHLVVVSELEKSDLVGFLLADYQPTPMIAPWNGRGGFNVLQNRPSEKIVKQVEDSTSRRLEPYRRAIRIARDAWDKADAYGMMNDKGGIQAKHKARFVELCRAIFPDEALAWLDTTVVLLDDSPEYPLILGTGGNVGSLDCSFTFLKQLEKLGLLDGDSGMSNPRAKSTGSKSDRRDASRALLEDALFDHNKAQLYRDTASQFDPGGLGGPNSSYARRRFCLAESVEFRARYGRGRGVRQRGDSAIEHRGPIGREEGQCAFHCRCDNSRVQFGFTRRDAER